MIQSHRSQPEPDALALVPAKEDRPPLDPILTLQVAMDQHTGAETPMGSASSRSSIASVCFLPTGTGSIPNGVDGEGAEAEEDDDSSSSEELQFQCRSLLQSEARTASDPTRQARQTAAATTLLAGRHLASCHANGECILWDLHQRRIVNHQLVDPRGPGWMLRRLGKEDSQFLYQTRDPRGTVSIHSSWDNAKPAIVSFPTFSQTFCAAAPCKGNSNLLALPSPNDSEATIRDLRMDPSSAPVAVFSASGGEDNSNDAAVPTRKHGMLTSLAFCGQSNNQPPIVACGMESGSVFFHDLRRLRRLAQPSPPSIKLCDDPVLGLDLAPSSPSGVVAIAGMAGENLNEQEGTVAIVKATTTHNNKGLKLRLRSRLATCKPQGPGKPGVNLCRFQPGDGRFFAVAGWDQRVRILDRSSNSTQPLQGILRAHAASVSAFDWAPDPASGLCATGAADGIIHVWRCLSH